MFSESFFGKVFSVPLSGSSAVAFFAHSLPGIVNTKIFAGKKMPSFAMSFGFTKFSRFLNAGEKSGELFGRKNFFNRKPPFNPADNGAARYIQLSNPLTNRFCNPVMGNKSIIPSVISLCSNGRPAAIFGGIPKFVINSIKAHSLRRITHVSKKVFKTFIPSIANFYSFGPVMLKGFMLRITAPSFHMIPNGISSRCRCAVSFFHVSNLSKVGGSLEFQR